MMNDELLRLELIKQEDIDKQTLDEPPAGNISCTGWVIRWDWTFTTWDF